MHLGLYMPIVYIFDSVRDLIISTIKPFNLNRKTLTKLQTITIDC